MISQSLLQTLKILAMSRGKYADMDGMRSLVAIIKQCDLEYLKITWYDMEPDVIKILKDAITISKVASNKLFIWPIQTSYFRATV